MLYSVCIWKLVITSTSLLYHLNLCVYFWIIFKQKIYKNQTLTNKKWEQSNIKSNNMKMVMVKKLCMYGLTRRYVMWKWSTFAIWGYTVMVPGCWKLSIGIYKGVAVANGKECQISTRKEGHTEAPCPVCCMHRTHEVCLQVPCSFTVLHTNCQESYMSCQLHWHMHFYFNVLLHRHCYRY